MTRPIDKNIFLEWECDSCFRKNIVRVSRIIGGETYINICDHCEREKTITLKVTVTDSEQAHPALIEVTYEKNKWKVLIKNKFDEIIEEKEMGRSNVARSLGQDLYNHYHGARLILYKQNGEVYKSFMSFEECMEERALVNNRLPIPNEISKFIKIKNNDTRYPKS